MTHVQNGYDPFARGRFPVGTRSIELFDRARGRRFPCEIWYPQAHSGTSPLIAYSHPSGGNRRSATYLCTHLSSHGYVVAALDHSELVAAELARGDAETSEQKAARTEGWIASRVPDVAFLIDRLLGGDVLDAEASIDGAAIGVVGHSFGGWTALARAGRGCAHPRRGRARSGGKLSA